MLLVIQTDEILTKYIRENFLGSIDVIDELSENEKVSDLIVPEHKVLLCDMDNLNLGIYFPKEIRKKFKKIAIIGLKEEITSEQRTLFLDSGGDDLILKEYSFSETLAIVNARKRIYDSLVTEKAFECVINNKKFTWDQSNTFILLDNKPLNIPLSKLRLLLYLLTNKGKTCSKEILLENCIKENEEKEIKLIDVHICGIRKQLKGFGVDNIIRTVRGTGYIID